MLSNRDNRQATEGYSRPIFNIYGLIKRLTTLEKAKSSYQEALKKLKQELPSNSTDATVLDRINRNQIALDKTFYEIEAIKKELSRRDRIDNFDTALLSEREEKAVALPYLIKVSVIDNAISAFELTQASGKFDPESNIIFSQAVLLLKEFRKRFRTFKHYDMIMVGTIIKVMMIEDKKGRSMKRRFGGKFLYPIEEPTQDDFSLIEAGKRALIEKTLPYDGKINPLVFKLILPVFPNYLAKEYDLTTTSIEMDTTQRTKEYIKKTEDKLLLRYFKIDYLQAYHSTIIKNPFSKMKAKLENGSVTADEIRRHVIDNPHSRSAKVFNLILAQGSQRGRIKQFKREYRGLYHLKFFYNPLSYMPRHLNDIQSTAEIVEYAIKNKNSRSAHALDKIVTSQKTLKRFLRK